MVTQSPPGSSEACRLRLFAPLLGVLFVLVGAAPSQDLPEAAALVAKGRADYPTMRAELTRLLREDCAVTDAEAGPAAAAHAEYCATMLERMTLEGGDTTTAAALLEAREAPLARAMPALRGRLGALLLRLLRTSGGEVHGLADELGVIRSIWVCGPFDNERGAGYAAQHEASSRFDPDARYPGKLSEVGWRFLPVQPRAGHLMLGEIMRSREQIMTYVATAVLAEEAHDVALLLGTSGAWRVYLNGAEVGARDVERELHDDQDAVVLPLQAGANLLVLKACHQEGPEFGAILRIAALDGGPATGVRCSDLREDLIAANEQAAREPSESASFADNARSFYAARAAEGDPAAALRLAALRTHTHVDGDRDARALRLCEQAMEGLPESAEAAFLRFWLRPRLQRSDADRDATQQRRDLAEVLRRDPQHVEARLLLAQIDLEASELPLHAERLMREALEIAPQSATAHGNLAAALVAQGLEGPAERVHRAVLELPCVGRGAGRNVFVRLSRDGDTSMARRLITQQLRWFALPTEQLMAARLIARCDGAEAGIAALKACRTAWPMARAPRLLLARTYTGLGRVEDALQELSGWLELCPDDDDALLEVAELHARRGDTERQVEMLQAAVDLNPNLAAQQRYLDYLRSDQQAFFAPFELDGAEVLAADDGPPDDADSNQDALHHVLRQRVVKAFDNGTTSEYVHEIVRVLREDGARRMAQWRPAYSYGSQRARVLSCVVHHPDGTTSQPRLSGGYVQIPSLRPGDVVDVRGRVDDTAPTFFGDYFGLEHYFVAPDGMPVARAQLTVVTTPGRDYRWQVQNGAPEPVVTALDGGEQRYDWQMLDLPRDEPEVARPLAKEWAPLARMTTYRDWDHFAGWWWNLIEKQIDVSNPMRAKVRELCRDAETPSQRLDAIYRFVTTDVRYEAWEFGVHGYKPYNTSVIFERRHGDCKDKALLLCAMLREVGIVARPVLIFADPRRSADDLEVPLMHHFNHCIAWLPEQDGIDARFVDGTADLHPSDTLPEMDQGAKVLVVEPDGADLDDVPVTSAERNAREVVYDVVLARDGSAEGKVTMLPTGNEAVAMRRLLVSTREDVRERLEQEMQRRFGPGSVTIKEMSDGSDLQAKVLLVTEFRIREFGRVRGETLEVLPGFDIGSLQQLTAAPEREHALLLTVPRRDHEMLRIQGPPGLQLSELPAPTRIERSFGTFTLDWRREGDRIFVERDLRLTATRIAVEDYAAFREFVAAVRDADSTRLVFRQKEER